MNFNALDLNLIRVLDALLKERSVTRAGERIGLSQPAVSAALNRLRHQFNDQLFVRSGHDMLPTPRAEALQEPVRAALALIEQTVQGERKVDPARLERTFLLLGSDFFATTLLPSLSARLAREAPGVRLRMLDSARGDVEKLLKDGTIDCALERPFTPPEWISSDRLFLSPFSVIASRANRALNTAGVRPGDTMPLDLFCDLPHALRSIDGSMTGITDDTLRKLGRKREVVLTLPMFHGIGLAVACGEIIAVVPTQFADIFADDLGLAVYRAPIDLPIQDIRLYWHRRHDHEPQHRWIRAEILSEVDRLGLNGANGRDASGLRPDGQDLSRVRITT